MGYKKSKSLIDNSIGYSRTTKMVMGSILAAIAALLQSAGIFTGIGYALSILTTLPIILATVISIRLGLMSYLITILLLFFLQPSELFVFPFTTGLLGLSLGIGLRWFKHSFLAIGFASLSLSTGIMFLLYIIKFPVLGPSISHSFDFRVIIGILLFSFLYTWLWLYISLYGIGFINNVIRKNQPTQSHKN